MPNEPINYKPGDWYVIDDRTGFKERASKVRKEWTGVAVHESVWEARHPQDFVRGTKDVQNPPWTRGEASNTFLQPNSVQGDDLNAVQSLRVTVSGEQRVTSDGDIRRTS